MAAELRDAQAFTRGFLLAMDWANAAPRPNLAERVPRLADEDIATLYGALRALPLESRQAMRITWSKREPLRRVDDGLEIHPSWIAELLGPEPPSTLLLALGELERQMGRDVLRVLWPKVRPSKPEDSVGEMKPLQPALAGHLRRRLFANFVQRSGAAPEPASSSRLLELNAAELWLLSQELGRSEMARTEATGDPESTAIEHLRAVRDLSPSEDQIVGLLGLRLLATALVPEPRARCQHVAQKMAYPIAQHLLRWRDTDTSAAEEIAQAVKEVAEKVDLILN